MNNLSKLSGSQLLLARIFSAAPARKVNKELDRRSQARPLITKQVAQRALTWINGAAA